MQQKSLKTDETNPFHRLKKLKNTTTYQSSLTFPRNHIPQGLPHWPGIDSSPSWSSCWDWVMLNRCCRSIRRLVKCSRRTCWPFGTFGCRNWKFQWFVAEAGVSPHLKSPDRGLFRCRKKLASMKKVLATHWRSICETVI